MPSFREDLDRFLTDRESFARRDCLYVCETPAIMVALGMKQLPIYITQGHTADVLHPKSDENRHWHGLGKEELLAVPELLGSPAIIMDSISRADTVVFVLAATDADELPLIAAIRPDGESRYFAIDAAAAQIAEGGWIEVGADVDDFLARCDGASPAGPPLPVVRQRGRLDVHGASPARRPSLDRDLKAAGDSARTQRLDSAPSMKAGKKHSEAEGM